MSGSTHPKIDFDEEIERKGSYSLKYDVVSVFFPEYKDKQNVSCNWVADMDFRVCPSIAKALEERSKNNNIFGYPGLLSQNDSLNENLISWCKKRHNYSIQRKWLNVTNNTLQTLHMLIKLKSKKNQAVVVNTPVYYKFIEHVQNINRVVVANELVYDKDNGRYSIDFEILEKQLSDENTKIMLFCNPHNPSGRVWTFEEVQKVTQLCLQHNVYLISDEIFADLVLPPNKHTVAGSISEAVNQNTATIFTASKAFNISGLGISTVLIPDEKLHQEFTVLSRKYGFYYANTLGQLAVEKAYTEEGESWLNQVLDYLQKNYDFLVEFLNKECSTVKVLKMEAAYLAVLDFEDTKMTYEQIKSALADHAVLIEDLMDFFYPPQGTSFFRINLACTKKKLQVCLQRIADSITVKQTSQKC